MLQIFREIGQGLLSLLLKVGKGGSIAKRIEVELSLSPAIRASFEKRSAELPPFEDVNTAIRVLKDLDNLIPNAKSTVVVLDELEVLTDDDRRDLAFFIKQVGDQDFRLRFVLVGIAENVHELIGVHQSIARYIKEVSLQPLYPQDLMDIVSTAAEAVGVEVPREYLLRVAIIGNGFPHFAHLMGKSMLIEVVVADAVLVTPVTYKLGVERAVKGSIQELKIAYETAVQRGSDYYKHLIWALANSDIVDVRNDEWLQMYHELEHRLGWKSVDESKLKNAIGNFKNDAYGKIIMSTPARYGSAEIRYRYKRFSNMLMRGHVRLQAEQDGVTLGRQPGM